MTPLVCAVLLAAVGVKEPVNTLDNTTADLRKFFAGLHAVRSPERVEALPVTIEGERLPSEAHVVEMPGRLSAATAASVGATLLDVGTYQGGMSACFFEPAVAFRFRRGADTVVALVCFKCSELIFEDGNARGLSGRMRFGGRGRARLLAAAKKAFPDDAVLQGIER